MEFRKDPLVTGEYYHIFNRSIAKFIIFNDQEDFLRFEELINLYRFINFSYKYSSFKNLTFEMQKTVTESLVKDGKLIEITAYCIMPTHIHLLLKQLEDDGISRYISKTLNSYTKYFNTKYHRKGPLWEGHFKNVLVNKDEQLLHLTRYIHLNPTSAKLVEKPNQWRHSSYSEYINVGSKGSDNYLCDFSDVIDLNPKQYGKFVNDRRSYQRELSIIKSTLIDDYTG